MSKKQKKKTNKPDQALSRQVMQVFRQNPGKHFNYKQLAKRIAVQDSKAGKQLMHILSDLADSNLLHEVSPGKYCLKSTPAYVEGVIQITSSGSAFVITPDSKEDIYISPKHVKTALHEDRVRVYLFAKRKGRQPEGEVTEVLERARDTFAGTVQVHKRFAFLVPDSPKMLVDIFIPKEHLNGAIDGQKAIARVIDWPDQHMNPLGEVTEVLGFPGDNTVEAHAILVEYGLPFRFEEEVEKAAEAINDVIGSKDIASRKDMRKVTTFTIDPDDAKDFDDALSYRKLGNGKTEVGVHIADVSHYVQPGSVLDNEAYRRATSVYLVDRVVPMLPERLSNGICSLRPDEDKLCFSVLFEFDDNARVTGHWIGRTVIRSDKRFTYAGAQEVIEQGKGPFAEEVNAVNSLAEKIRADRFEQGAIAFESIETKFVLNDEGEPVDVYFKETKASNHLIEEFMLLANKYVATYVGKAKRGPFVYRIHDTPKREKLEQFEQFINKFGHSIRAQSKKGLSHSFNALMVKIKDRPEEHIIEQLSIRTMEKAVYSTNNIGHYGLAFPYYTHFTSPIRRYPDILVHRLLQQYLDDKKVKDAEQLEKQCKHASDMEKRAVDAERASTKFMQVQFMRNKVGKTFNGIISGVTEWGLYVELESSKCEGMVRLKDIDDDYYVFDEDNYCVTGHRYGRKYQLGDKVKVKLKRADPVNKQLDFDLLT